MTDYFQLSGSEWLALIFTYYLADRGLESEPKDGLVEAAEETSRIEVGATKDH